MRATPKTSNASELSGSLAALGTHEPEPSHRGALIPAVRYCPMFCSPTAREILVADADDLAFILHLQKRFSNAIGFLPTQAIEWYVANRRVLTAVENGQHAGYCLGRASLRWNRQIQPITQCAISYDLQRRHAGLALVRRVEDEARQAGRQALQAMCRADLDANDFWRAAGFTDIGHLEPANRRQKEIICWRKALTLNPHPWLFQMPPVAGHRAKRTPRPTQPLLFNLDNDA